MENFHGKRKSATISVSLFSSLSDSFSLDKPPAKSPRNFPSGAVGLGIVAAMTDGLSVPIPIPIVSSAKAAANFRGGMNLEPELDEASESYTCVISRGGGGGDNNTVTKRVYFDGKLSGVVSVAEVSAASGVFSASPASVGEMETEVWSSDFLSCCILCKKQLHGLDIFMYRGEKAFCSWDCRDKHIRSEDHKEKCSFEAMKPLDYSVSPCSSPRVFLAGVAAA